MIDRFTSIIKNPPNLSICDLQMMPQDQKILVVSPNSLSLIDISIPNTTNVLSNYNLSEKLQNEYGVFISASCLSLREFAVLTSKGRIARFNINKSMQIDLCSISVPKHSNYTCLTQYSHKYYIAGDEKGHFIILSADLKISYIKDFFDISIKQICTSHSYGYILLSDNKLYSFKINNTSIDKNEFDLEIYPETDFSEISFTKICSSNEFNTNAIYDPNGILYLVNKKDDMTNYIQKITNLSGLLTMSFSNSENLLILVFNEKIGIWNSYYNRIFYVYLPEIQTANCVAVSNKFVALSLDDKGIGIYPLIHRSHSMVPLMFSSTKIFEFIPTSDSILANEHEISLPAQNDDSNFIEFASGDKYNKFVAIATKHRIFIYNRNSQHIKLIADKLSMIREIEWFSRFLCVLTFDPGNTSFNLVIFRTKKNSSEFQLEHKIKLKSRPFHVRSNNDDKLIVTFYKSILILDKELNQSVLKIPGFLEEVYPHENFIFALATPKVGQRNLISITYDGQILNLKENVDTFFVSHKFNLLFALSGTDVFITSTSHIRFTVFICTDAFPIGVTIPNSICAFITLKNNSSRLDPSLSFFFDYAISTNEHFSPENKKKALMALNANIDNKKAIILQSSVFLLRQKKGSDCVSFISNFPDLFNEVLINAMRCVESDERKDIYSFVGLPSKFFSNLTGTEMVNFDTKTIKFQIDNTKEENDEDFILSSLLLPVILEDEGFTVAFSAAFFLISQIHKFRKTAKPPKTVKKEESSKESSFDADSVDDFEYTQNELNVLQSFFRFIDPILGHVSAIDPDHVSVLGAELDNNVYTELMQQYEEVVNTKLRRMMKFYRPLQMIQFSIMGRYSAHYFLSENKEKFENFSIDEIVKNLNDEDFVRDLHIRTDDDNNAVNTFDEDVKTAAELFRRVGLRQWELALWVKTEKFEEAKKAVENDSDLISILQKSELHQVFGL